MLALRTHALHGGGIFVISIDHIHKNKNNMPFFFSHTFHLLFCYSRVLVTKFHTKEVKMVECDFDYVAITSGGDNRRTCGC